MQDSLVFALKLNKGRPLLIGRGIISVLMGTALLSLQTPARAYLLPHAPYLQLGLLLGVSSFLLPLLRLRIWPANFWFLTALSTLFIVALASSLCSPYPRLVIQRSVMIVGSSLFISILALADPEPMATFTRLAKALALFGTVVSLLGLTVYLFGKLEVVEFGQIQTMSVGSTRISQRVYGSRPFLRISSVLGNPNTLALWLLSTLTMTAFLFLQGSYRKLLVLATLVQMSALILTFSRAGIVATLLSMVLLWCLSPADRGLQKRRAFVLGLVAVSLVFFLALPFAWIPRSERLSLSLNLRDLAWTPLWTSIRNNPLLGVGFGVSYEGILELQGLEIGAHNAFLAVWSEIGLVGFLLFLLLWFVPIWYGRKRLRFSPQPVRVTLATCLAISLALIPHQVFEGAVLRYGFHTLIWVYLLALMVHPGLRGKQY